jgi:hypothetical protein
MPASAAVEPPLLLLPLLLVLPPLVPLVPLVPPLVLPLLPLPPPLAEWLLPPLLERHESQPDAGGTSLSDWKHPARRAMTNHGVPRSPLSTVRVCFASVGVSIE